MQKGEGRIWTYLVALQKNADILGNIAMFLTERGKREEQEKINWSVADGSKALSGIILEEKQFTNNEGVVK